MTTATPTGSRHRASLRSAVGCAGLLLAAFVMIGPTCQPLLRANVVASGLASPMYVTAPAGDARVFIVERAGTVRILANGSVLAAPFLDISANVGTAGEGGLLSIAFSPDYASDGQLYAFYSNRSNTSVLSRFVRSSTDPNRADATSEFVLLTLQPGATNHKGGTIAFSPVDRYLYIGIGDGGSNSALARDPDSLFGKMLRLDVSGGAQSAYTIPSTNPFAGPDGVRDEIWSLGFRNPFRWSFDRANGDLWIADVGQNSNEEIDYEPVGTGGRDYGWPTHEGNACFQPTAAAPCDDPQAPVRYTFPVYQYTHAEGCSITGGSVSRGGAAFLNGAYLFSDLCSGHVWALINGSRVELDAMLGVGTLGGLVALSEDSSGRIHLVQLNAGTVYRID